jgi:hypothetical protein
MKKKTRAGKVLRGGFNVSYETHLWRESKRMIYTP